MSTWEKLTNRTKQGARRVWSRVRAFFSVTRWARFLAWIRVRKNQYIAGGAVLCLAVISIATSVALHTTVPDFEGRTFQESQSIAADAGLSLDEVVNWRPNLAHEFQIVDSQSVSEGQSIWRGTPIRLTMGPIDVTTPNVLGKTLKVAKEKLKAVGLSFTSIYDNEEAQAFTVATQSIPAGAKVSAGRPVALTLNLPDIPVPDVRGLVRDDALAKLRKAGFAVGTPDYVNVTAEWTAASTVPAVSTPARYGSTIVINYVGPLVSVPDMASKSPSGAESALKDAGFTMVKEPANASYDWYATGQSVAAGGQANKGSAITVTFSPPTIEYSVSGNGTRALITWIPPGSYSVSQDSDASVPWSKVFETTSGYGNFSAQAMNGTEITCTIKRDGKVVKTNTSTGRYSVVTCG